MGVVEVAEWASSFNTHALTRALRQAVYNAKEEGYEHLVLRARPDASATTWAASEAGFRLVDIGTDLRFPIQNVQFAPIGVREWAPDDLGQLRRIAGQSFVYSRFQVDPFFSDAQVVAFHETWVTNLCNGLARQVLVTGEPGNPTGFVACSVSGRSGRIALIAVDEEHRGCRIGARLVASALRWFASQECEEVWVKTQSHNYPALSLYELCGFRTARTELTFSTSLRPDPICD